MGEATFRIKTEESGSGKGVVREGKFDGERVEGEAKGDRREGGASGEQGGESAGVGEHGMAKHGEEVVEGKESVGVCGDE